MSELSDIDYTKQTELCRIMNKYGSDKGNGWHNYTTLYTKLFEPLRNNDIHLLEVGIGSTDPYQVGNMGPNGKIGASLFGWEEYFPKGLIYGLDIDPKTMFRTSRISTFQCDQTKTESVKEAVNNLPELDIIVDDGLHEYFANLVCLNAAIHRLKKGGIYIVEDILTSELENYKASVPYLIKSHKLSYAEVRAIPNPRNTVDNNLLIIVK
jgi:hypothetical protein